MPGKHNTLYTNYIAYNHVPGKHNTLHTTLITIKFISILYNTQSLEVIIKVWVVLTALAFTAYMYYLLCSVTKTW